MFVIKNELQKFTYENKFGGKNNEKKSIKESDIFTCSMFNS